MPPHFVAFWRTGTRMAVGDLCIYPPDVYPSKVHVVYRVTHAHTAGTSLADNWVEPVVTNVAGIVGVLLPGTIDKDRIEL